MARYHKQERVLQAPSAPTEKGTKVMNEREREALATQQQTRFTNLPADQRDEFEREREGMWSQIPAHLQDKARKLAGR